MCSLQELRIQDLRVILHACIDARIDCVVGASEGRN